MPYLADNRQQATVLTRVSHSGNGNGPLTGETLADLTVQEENQIQYYFIIPASPICC